MCGIAGIVDLVARRPPPEEAALAMARALYHRGPDEEGARFQPGLALVSRRLSIVGIADGQQPMSNERGTVHVVFNGELFDHVEQRERLKAKGHEVRTSCDTEIIPHMWEESGRQLFGDLRGQFAVALWDDEQGTLYLGRDRFGICPLYWTRQGDWLLFASEIKALLASGMVDARPDLRGIDHVFSFAAVPGPTTCFEGIRLLEPGHFLEIRPGDESGRKMEIINSAYWEMDFPDAGSERDEQDASVLVREFEELLLKSVDERLRADVPVGSYLSGGVDSSMILALANHLRPGKITTYTVRVDSPELDELSAASKVAAHVGAPAPIVQEFRHSDALENYPALIRAAEAPVIDTSCAALLQLARKVHDNNQKVVLTGEGADEWLAGYPWYKAAKLINYLDSIPGLRLSNVARRGYLRLSHVPQYPRSYRRDIETFAGGHNAWIDSYGMIGLSKLRFYGDDLAKIRDTHNTWEDLGINVDRARKWHPLHRGVWVAARVTLAGHLLQAKGDRIAMNSSVEVRYPFLDEDVFQFLAQLHPRWKLRGFRDKHLLRLVAEKWLPKEIYQRGKVIFRAPLDSFHLEPETPLIAHLLSDEVLHKTGYFDVAQVRHWRKAYRTLRPNSLPRLSVEMGLVAVTATQIWHQTFIDPNV